MLALYAILLLSHHMLIQLHYSATMNVPREPIWIVMQDSANDVSLLAVPASLQISALVVIVLISQTMKFSSSANRRSATKYAQIYQWKHLAKTVTLVNIHAKPVRPLQRTVNLVLKATSCTKITSA